VTGITAPILPLHFQKQGTKLRLFTTVATLGTPQVITLQELRIESFFPMDQETRKVFRNWAGERRKKKARTEQTVLRIRFWRR